MLPICKRLIPSAVSCAILLALIGSCTQNGFLNLISAGSDFSPPFGEPVPRVMSVGFINNTPFRAIFTFGGYDQLDQDGLPIGFGQIRVEGNTSSPQIAQPCRKTFSVGGDELILRIERNREDPVLVITDEAALVNGVNFSGAPLGDPLEAEPTEGTAEGMDRLIGVDFTCERTDIRQNSGTGLLLFTFVEDAASPGGFRIDYQFVPQ
jgi:hypothetical protein